MKTIANQLKYPRGLRVQVFLKMGIKNCRYSFFMPLQIDSKQKISWVLPENAFEAVKPYFGPQNLFHCTFVEHR